MNCPKCDTAVVRHGALTETPLRATCPHCLWFGAWEGKNPAAVSLGRRGGQSRSAAKVAAARENGKKGGRPKSTRETP